MPSTPTNGRIEEVLKLCGFEHCNQGRNSKHFIYRKRKGQFIYEAMVSKNKKKSPPIGTFNNIVARSGLPKEYFYMKNKDIKKLLVVY